MVASLIDFVAVVDAWTIVLFPRRIRGSIDQLTLLQCRFETLCRQRDDWELCRETADDGKSKVACRLAAIGSTQGAIAKLCHVTDKVDMAPGPQLELSRLLKSSGQTVPGPSIR
jgi:hypothetical protein